MNTDELFNDSAPVEATDTEIKTIGALAEQACAMADEIAAMEESLKARKNDLDKLLQRDLPDAMDAANCGKFVTKDGRELVVKDLVRASIPKAKEVEAFAWLRDNGHGDLIKHVLSIQLDRGKDNMVPEISQALARDYGLTPTDKTSVHAQTLTAFCREQLAAGNELPADLLGLYATRITSIK